MKEIALNIPLCNLFVYPTKWSKRLSQILCCRHPISASETIERANHFNSYSEMELLRIAKNLGDCASTMGNKLIIIIPMCVNEIEQNSYLAYCRK
jgi:hypothetical protein